MRKSLHPGSGERPRRASLVMKEEAAKVEEEIFNPEAAKIDDNPFPEEVVEESPVEESPVEESPVEESPVEESPVEESPLPNYESMTVEELRALCRAKELAVNGKKADIIARLTEADAPSEEAVEATIDAPSEEAASSNETGDVSNAPEQNETTNDVG